MIYLLRHGQTDYNRDGRLQGQTDSQLTSLGMAQVRAMAAVLAEQIDDLSGWRILASPLRRTRQSAAIVSQALRLPVEIEPALIEVGCGSWENRMYADLRIEQPAAFAGRDWVFNSPDGERFEDVDGRVRPWLATLPPEPERKVIAVSHGIAGVLMRGAYQGLSREETLEQDTPQDALFRLRGGKVERLACAPVAA
ncbi:histidine phosphatase family protein [Phenylobacterium sp.]|uniref:histidine phosphatase family protein n=1 Tax=Phenylobacterium sp. TaxID=1871053 RepID=UPI00289E5AE8|nr:histidine phosphatase family protein [Phenylobacterium sp.]